MAKTKKAKRKKAKVSKKARKGRNTKAGQKKKAAPRVTAGPKLLAALKDHCGRCGGPLGSDRGARSYDRPQTVALYARKDGQWLAVEGMKLCRNCWKALVKRAQAGYCYSCRGNTPDGAAHRAKTGHSVTRGPRHW